MTFQSHNPLQHPSPTIHTGELSWEDTYGIALALQRAHPTADLEQVSLGMIYQWTLDLPEFIDDPELANEDILMSIYQEWFEEANSL
jgi:FeS assembly protein IscX